MSKSLPQFRWLVAVFVFLVVMAGAWFGLRVTQITCSIDTQPCTSSQVADFNFLLGRHILFFNSDKILAQTQANSEFRITKMSFQLPETAVLELATQVAAYNLATDGQPQPLTISATGQVIAQPSQSPATTLFVTSDIWQQVKVQGTVDPQFQQQIQTILATLQTNNQPAPFLTWIDSQTLVLDNPSQPQIILDPTNLRTDLARLKVTLQALTSPEGATSLAQTQEIDVRFQLPVLRNSLTIPRHQAS